MTVAFISLHFSILHFLQQMSDIFHQDYTEQIKYSNMTCKIFFSFEYPAADIYLILQEILCQSNF